MPGDITAADIRKLISERYRDQRQYAVAYEVGNSTGAGQYRRIDVVAVNCYASKGFAIEGIEIKVSRADLMREVQDASKHNIFFPNLDYYSVAFPDGIAKPSELPDNWGIYTIKDGKLRTTRKPKPLHDEGLKALDKGFAAALCRCMATQSPAKGELDELIRTSRELAYKEGFEAARRTYAARKAEDLEALERLREECRVWGAGDIDEGIAAFKAYRELNPELLYYNLEKTRDKLNKTLELLAPVEPKPLNPKPKPRKERN